jgi:2-amino-4-hydroxy-6-hydroxymethyldihydropteridine diphosphokinase
MARAYIGLGANLGEPAAQIESALGRLAATPDVCLVARSSLYRSDPIGPLGQPHYCNAVCAIETRLDPPSLLDVLHAIEDAAGRVRGAERWVARTLDLDLLTVDNLVCETPNLKLPHPQLARRAFVLVPLAEIAPRLEIPGLGQVDQLVARIDRGGLSMWPRPVTETAH